MRRIPRGRTAPLVGLLALALTAAGCAAGGPDASSRAPSAVGTEPGATTIAASGPLVAPKTSPATDAAYLAQVTKADPALATYVRHDGDVALRALLTDGSAFCAFLARGGGIDNAMVSVVLGARGVQQTTHLPSSVETFNAIEAVALLELCPSELTLVPPAVAARIRGLASALAAPGH